MKTKEKDLIDRFEDIINLSEKKLSPKDKLKNEKIANQWTGAYRAMVLMCILFLSSEVDEILAKKRLVEAGFDGDKIESVSAISDVPIEDLESLLDCSLYTIDNENAIHGRYEVDQNGKIHNVSDEKQRLDLKVGHIDLWDMEKFLRNRVGYGSRVKDLLK